MKNLTVFGSALALAVALGAFPMAAAYADQAAEDAAKAAHEEAMANCESMSNQEAKAQCVTQADANLDAALQAAMKK